MDGIKRAVNSIENNIRTNKTLANRGSRKILLRVESIDTRLTSFILGMSELDATLHMLILYNKLDSPKKEWARLISRQINRLMNYNEWLLDDFWKQFRSIIVCAMNETIGENPMDENWNRFNKIINFEKKTRMS